MSAPHESCGHQRWSSVYELTDTENRGSCNSPAYTLTYTYHVQACDDCHLVRRISAMEPSGCPHKWIDFTIASDLVHHEQCCLCGMRREFARTEPKGV